MKVKDLKKLLKDLDGEEEMALPNGNSAVKTDGKDDVFSLSGEMARIISQKYLQNIQRIRLEQDMADITHREYQRNMDRAEITAELCLELMDTLIIDRYGYIMREQITRLKAEREGKQ